MAMVIKEATINKALQRTGIPLRFIPVSKLNVDILFAAGQGPSHRGAREGARVMNEVFFVLQRSYSRCILRSARK
jgi:hypothetical protein